MLDTASTDRTFIQQRILIQTTVRTDTEMSAWQQKYALVVCQANAAPWLFVAHNVTLIGITTFFAVCCSIFWCTSFFSIHTDRYITLHINLHIVLVTFALAFSLLSCPSSFCPPSVL